MAKSTNTGTSNHEDMLKQVVASGIINPEAKLGDLISLTQQVTSTHGGLTEDGTTNCFVHSGYVFLHMQS